MAHHVDDALVSARQLLLQLMVDSDDNIEDSISRDDDWPSVCNHRNASQQHHTVHAHRSIERESEGVQADTRPQQRWFPAMPMPPKDFENVRLLHSLTTNSSCAVQLSVVADTMEQARTRMARDAERLDMAWLARCRLT